MMQPAKPSQSDSWAIIPEIAAGVAKIMSNKDLILAQPRSATSRVAATRWANEVCWEFSLPPGTILTMTLAESAGGIEGLLYGCGDAVIGVNPAPIRSKLCADSNAP
jgi:ethanolamine ammonia-lyase large subunit